jgi:hypothetical protein
VYLCGESGRNCQVWLGAPSSPGDSRSHASSAVDLIPHAILLPAASRSGHVVQFFLKDADGHIVGAGVYLEDDDGDIVGVESLHVALEHLDAFKRQASLAGVSMGEASDYPDEED